MGTTTKLYNVHEAKTHLSRLLEAVQGGEEIILGRAGKPIAKLIPYYQPVGQRELGRLKGKIKIGADFDSLPPEILDGFGGGKS